MKTFVLGGGITGLSSAYLLSDEKEVVVLEKNSSVGGMSGSFRYKDFILDYGPHKIYSTIPGVMPYFKNLLGDSCLTIEKKNSLYLLGKPLSFPPRPLQVLGIGPIVLLKCGVSYFFSLVKKIFPTKKAVSYEDYMINGFGTATYDLIFKGYAEKVWGNPKIISEEIGRKRIPVPNIIELAKNMLIKKAVTPGISAKYFYYPKNGFQEISDKFAEKIEKNKGEIKLKAEIEKIFVERGKVKGVQYKYDNQLIDEKTDLVVSTIYLKDLLKYISPKPKKEIIDAAEKLTFRSLIIFYVALNKKMAMKDNWVFFPEKKYVFNRVSEIKSFSQYTCPKDKTVLMAEVTCDPKEVFKIDEKKMGKRVLEELEAAGLIKKEYVAEVFTKRAERVYPFYSVSYKKHLKKVIDYIDNIEGLYTIGRQGLFNYNNTDHCLDMSMVLNDHIKNKRKKDEWKKISLKFDDYKIVD